MTLAVPLSKTDLKMDTEFFPSISVNFESTSLVLLPRPWAELAITGEEDMKLVAVPVVGCCSEVDVEPNGLT